MNARTTITLGAFLVATTACTSGSSTQSGVDIDDDGTDSNTTTSSGPGTTSTDPTTSATTDSTTTTSPGTTTDGTSGSSGGTDGSGSSGTDGSTGDTVYECGVATAIELTPTDTSSASAVVFDPLPSASPADFGFGDGEIRVVDFDNTPDDEALLANASLTDEYAALGVTMNDIRIDSDVYEGPASPPNATEDNEAQIFTFSVPVVRVGIINTSPDQDTVQLWSGPNATGEMLFEFVDQAEEASPNFGVDRFVGVACAGAHIGSLSLSNASGDLELDELVFELAAE